LDLGFESVGFKVVYRNEVNSVFADSSKYAFEAISPQGAPDIHRQSLVDTGPGEILRRAFGSIGAPSVFGMIGGPPCPDFSVGGKNRGSSGDRGKLTEVYVERILEVKPTFFVLENVKGLISTQKHRLFLESLKRRLATEYVLDQRILNALDFGVPQDRERVFLIGVRRNFARRGIHNETFKWPRLERYHGSKQLYIWPTITPLGESPTYPNGVPIELTVWGAIGDEDRIRALPNGEDMFLPRSDKFLIIAEGDDRRKSFKRLHRWRYSPTVAYGNNEVHLHPTQPRRISVREALRLQTVPDNYAFPPKVPLSSKFKMVGNGVPVRLARAVATALAKHMGE
jgi:DNA (cytosine-5)-methyltransferase 1